MNNLISLGITPDVHLYIHSNDNFDIRARMFAPMDGVPEDPATGSANSALAGLLAHCSDKDSGQFSWRIAQGVEMGRPSILEVRAEKQAGLVSSVGLPDSTYFFWKIMEASRNPYSHFKSHTFLI
jgi:trans-2,3-dihydro-3-hydroxyanthranilate isomerase